MALALGMNELKLEVVEGQNHFEVRIEKAWQEEETEARESVVVCCLLENWVLVSFEVVFSAFYQALSNESHQGIKFESSYYTIQIER